MTGKKSKIKSTAALKAYYETLKSTCPVCQTKTFPIIDSPGKVWTVSEWPSEKAAALSKKFFWESDVRESFPWGSDLGYKVFRGELIRAGLSFSDFGHVYLLNHDTKNKQCYGVWFDALVELLSKKKITHVVAFGDVYEALTGYKGKESYGIWEESKLLPRMKVTAAPSQDAFREAPLGDLRVALKLVGNLFQNK